MPAIWPELRLVLAVSLDGRLAPPQGGAAQIGGRGDRRVLEEALAYLECRVQNRMDCGDHWLVYATVENGKLLEAVGVTAVQQRKSGGYY